MQTAPTESSIPSPQGPQVDPSAPTVIQALRLTSPVGRAVALWNIFSQWRMAHEPLFQEADRAYHFYMGNQWGYYSAALTAYVPIPTWSPDVIRVTMNKIQPGVEQMVSILTAERPVFGAVAGSTETIDSAASEAANDVCEWIQNEFDLLGMRRRMARGCGIAGWRWVLVEWDSSAGSMVTQPVPLGVDASGEPISRQPGPEGSFSFKELSHRQVVWDPSAMRWGEGAAVFVCEAVSRFDLRSRFPNVRVEQIVQSCGDESLRRVWGLGQPAQSSLAPGAFAGGDAGVRDDAIVVTAIVPSCKDFPMGRRVVFADGIVFDETDNPVYPTPEESAIGEPWPKNPFGSLVRFVHLERESSPVGRGPTTSAIPGQQMVNGGWSKFAQHAAKLGGMKLFVPMALTTEMSDETVQVVPYARSVDMTHAGYRAPPDISAQFVNMIREGEAAIDEALGINAATKGQANAEDSNAKVKTLQQQDIGRLQPVKEDQDRAEIDLLRYALFLFRRHADVPRKVQVVGENRRGAIKMLDRTAILPSTNIVLYNDRSIPRDPAQRMVWLQSFIQTGVLQLPAEQRETIIQLMRLRDFKGFMEHQAPHRDRARRENIAIMGGGDIGVLQMDDHLIHMKVLDELILSEEFETKVKEELLDPANGGQSPTYLKTFTHRDEHKAMLMGQVSAQGGGGAMPGDPAAGVAGPGAAQPASPQAAATPTEG